MATEITADDFVAKPIDTVAKDTAALEAAHAQALAELQRIRAKASLDATPEDDNPDYSMHDVSGMGRYVVPRHQGWKALLKIIHDPVPNIDFSANIYPAFDGVIGQHFQSPYLLDPLDEKYESYENLRDNLAAVRNFLMQTYYADTPKGMTPQKAAKAMDEIAGFVGDGLYNNWLYLGIIPNHNPTKPFISIHEASKENGKGAQYIYEKILEHQRHSNWMKPFAAVAALFGGKDPEEWLLPPASETHFRDKIAYDEAGVAPLTEEAQSLQAAAATVAALEAKLQTIKDARTLSSTAIDLDAIGNHLIYTATHMDGVAQMAAPVRRDAVEIAKDILRKLKLSIGNANVVDGLNMKPSDDMATLGAVKGVAMVYERLLAWARINNDAGIFQHPSVMAATQAIGQLGYQAKREALRVAGVAGNHGLVKAIKEQIDRLPSSYKSASGSFGQLFETIERGIDTVMTRVQEVNVTGAKVGFSVDSSMGTTLGNAPTAGTSAQVGVNDAAQRNAQAMQADQLAAQAQANRINSQLAAQAQAQRQQQGQPQQQPQAQPRGATVGRQSLQSAQRAQTSQSRPASSTAPAAPSTAPLASAQQQAANRQTTMTALADARRRDEQLRQDAQRQRDQQQAQRAARAAMRIDPNALKGISGFDMTGVTGAPITGGRRPITPQAVQAQAAKQQAAKQTQATTERAAANTAKQSEEEKQRLTAATSPTTPNSRNNGGRGL